MFFDEKDKSGLTNEVELKCPRCGGAYLHHGLVTVFDRGEDAPSYLRTDLNNGQVTTRIVVHKTPEAAGNPSSRRDGLTIRFSCEACPKEVPDLELTISQHKGNTYVGWRTALPAEAS